MDKRTHGRVYLLIERDVNVALLSAAFNEQQNSTKKQHCDRLPPKISQNQRGDQLVDILDYSMYAHALSQVIELACRWAAWVGYGQGSYSSK